jgi:hypothetical protein
MRQLIIILSVGALVASPAVAVAGDTTRADHPNAAKLCKLLRAASGTEANFASGVQTLYADGRTKVTAKNAFGKCVSYYARRKTCARRAAGKGHHVKPGCAGKRRVKATKPRHA